MIKYIKIVIFRQASGSCFCWWCSLCSTHGVWTEIVHARYRYSVKLLKFFFYLATWFFTPTQPRKWHQGKTELSASIHQPGNALSEDLAYFSHSPSIHGATSHQVDYFCRLCHGACWVCLCCYNPPNSGMDYRIFIVCTDVNACDCTRRCMDKSEE